MRGDGESMRILVDIVRQSLATLWAHKLRSFLTMFGIAWGVGSLLLLVGLGEGFRSGQERELANLGQNIMFMFPGRIPAVPGSTVVVRQQAKLVGAVSPVLNREDIRAVSDYGSTNGQVFGVASDYNQIRNVPINPGRWFNEKDNAERRRVAIVGWELLKNMFPGRPAVGSTILLNGISFDVIGVVEKVGRDGNNGTNSRIFIPIDTMRNLFRLTKANSEDAISFINYQPRSRAVHEKAQQEVERVIARNHSFDPSNPDSFDEWDTIRTVDQIGKIFDAMNLFLGSVGLVTLALGAIGIINIMLVAVADRTREIGLRKAVGATNNSIMFQFFVEGAFLTLMSGGIGIGGAAGLMALLSNFSLGDGFDPPKLVASTAALAVVSLGVAGIAAGLYPARRAALLEPVEALRKE